MFRKKEKAKTQQNKTSSDACKKLTLKKVGTRELSNEELKLVAGATPNWGHHSYH